MPYVDPYTVGCRYNDLAGTIPVTLTIQTFGPQYLNVLVRMNHRARHKLRFIYYMDNIDIYYDTPVFTKIEEAKAYIKKLQNEAEKWCQHHHGFFSMKNYYEKLRWELSLNDHLDFARSVAVRYSHSSDYEEHDVLDENNFNYTNPRLQTAGSSQVPQEDDCVWVDEMEKLYDENLHKYDRDGEWDSEDSITRL